MKGITILNTITHTIYGFGWSWIGFFAGLCCVIVIIFLILFIKQGGDTSGEQFGSAFLAILFGTISIVCFSCGKEIGTYETYEVTVEDTVTYLEFTEKFEVIDQRGAIYEVKLKDVED